MNINRSVIQETGRDGRGRAHGAHGLLARNLIDSRQGTAHDRTPARRHDCLHWRISPPGVLLGGAMALVLLTMLFCLPLLIGLARLSGCSPRFDRGFLQCGCLNEFQIW